MKFAFPRLFLASLFFGLILLASSASAQYRASLRGTVTDPSGAAVAGVKVTLVDTSTSRTVISTSDANGIYQFNALPVAPYRLTAEAAGFKPTVLEDVHIISDQPNGLDVQLQVGATTETVTVSGITEALDTETATVSGTITENQVQHMPSFGRDVFQLTQLAPGVFGDGAQGNGGGGHNLPGTQGPGGTGGNAGIFQTENGPQAVAAGQQYENNGISIDGISTTSAVWGGTTIITPSEESVDNVKVVSNSYDAESGRFGGAQIQVTSKSGTNDFHGSLFFYAHRPGLDAYQPFNGNNNKPVRDNSFFDQLGGSVGGPIWKNKIFAFFNYETIRSPQAQTNISNGWYETPAFDKSAPAGSIAATYLSFPGAGVVSRGINPSTCGDAGLAEGVNCATIPGQGLDIGSPLTTGLGTQDPTWTSASNPGVGNGLDGVADIANYITASTSKFSKAQYNGRLDANITGTDRIGFAIYWVPQTTTFLNGPARQYNFFHHDQINEAFSAIWNHTFSSSLLNEFRVNAAGWHWNEVASNPQSPSRIFNTWNAQKDNFGPQIGFAWSPSMFNDKLVVRGGYGLGYNQEEIAISSGIVNNPGLTVNPTFNMSTPGSPNPGIIYAPSSDVHSLNNYPSNANTLSTFGSNGLPANGTPVNVSIFPRNLPTMRVHHYSLDTQYDLGHHLIATLGYMGSISHDIFFHENPNATPAVLGIPLNPQIGGGDFWGVSGHGNYNALLAELKHQFSQQFMADAQFTWAKTMDTSSGPYFEQPYPYDPSLSYGRSDYNVGKAFKLFGVWQPVLFHGDRGWVEKIAGGWSLSGIFNIHSGFPWSPLVNVNGGSLYCGTCGYTSLFPIYLGGAGTSTSNDQFKTGSNYSKGSLAYFANPRYTPFGGTSSGTARPQLGLQRNSFNGPGYKDVDLTLSKAFGFPNMPVLGENSRVEFRLDAYNIFNNLNFDPASISNNIGDPDSGDE